MPDSAELAHFLTEWATSVKASERAEATFRSVVQEYQGRNYQSEAIALHLASSDLRLKEAVADGTYYRDRAVMYGISAMVQIVIEDRAEGVL